MKDIIQGWISQYFLESYELFSGNEIVGFDLSNFTAKADLNGASSIDTSTLPSKRRFSWFNPLMTATRSIEWICLIFWN